MDPGWIGYPSGVRARTVGPGGEHGPTGYAVNRLILVGWLLAAIVLSGCAGGARATDPPAAAVRDSRSAVASLVLTLDLQLAQRATEQLTQVVLEQCLEDLGAAQQELLTASDADPVRRATAGRAVGAAADILVALGTKGAGELDAGDLAQLQQVERDLATTAQDLGA